MKNTTKNIVMLSILWLLLISQSGPTVHAEKQNFLTALYNKEIFPYVFGNGAKINLEKPGIAVDLLQSLEKRVPIKISFIRLPQKRMFYELKRGEVDGIIASFKPDRKKFGVYPMKDDAVDPSRRISSDNYVLYTLKGSPLKWDDQHKRFLNHDGLIGAPLGYSIVADLKKWGARIEESLDPVSTLEKLIRGRIQGLAGLETTIDHLLSKKPEKYKNIQKLQPALVMKPYYLVLSHQFVQKQPALAQLMWNVLAEIRENEFSTISLKYY